MSNKHLCWRVRKGSHREWDGQPDHSRHYSLDAAIREARKAAPATVGHAEGGPTYTVTGRYDALDGVAREVGR